MANEQDILSFCDITGASVEVANQFLEIADGNVQTAVTLFLENGGAAVNTSAHDTAESSREPEHVEISDDQILADEELARRLQESQEVRAPIAPKRDILAGDAGLFDPSITWSSSSRERNGISRPSIFNQGDSTTGSIVNVFDIAEDDDHSPRSVSPSETANSSSHSKARRLADLFRPPFDIMFRGSFEQARETAKENDKWIMVNIQNPSEFSCQVLNRDLWSDGFVKDIIRQWFIFLQFGHESPDGRRYCTYYSLRRYPHIAIIDSRTGERVKVWEKSLSPTDFVMEVTEFLEGCAAAEEKATMKRPKLTKETKNLTDMSEEEQLNAAIAASLNNTSSSSSSLTNDNEEPVEKEEESVFDSIKPIKREEAGGEDTTRIQIRMGNGNRIVRRFKKSDPVRYLFEFIKAEIPEAENQHFELVFNRTQLIDIVDQSIADAGLSNAAINCLLTTA
ncbi:hypothetical protein RMATCC62417_03265 [Rhizopus microsporus]|nr:hypothetical protein RMATCC62417_03265 [Rhizopus microsporus]